MGHQDTARIQLQGPRRPSQSPPQQGLTRPRNYPSFFLPRPVQSLHLYAWKELWGRRNGERSGGCRSYPSRYRKVVRRAYWAPRAFCRSASILASFFARKPSPADPEVLAAIVPVVSSCWRVRRSSFQTPSMAFEGSGRRSFLSSSTECNSLNHLLFSTEQ